MAIELISFDELDVYLDLAKSESGYPDLTLIQESVVTAIENRLDRRLTLEGAVETLYLYACTKMIPLKSIPIKTVSSVSIDGVATTGYKIRGYGIELTYAVDNVEVTVAYEGGLNTVHPDLKRAALLQTVYEYQNKDSIGIQSTSTEGGTTTKPELGLLKEVKQLLHRHRHPFISL